MTEEENRQELPERFCKHLDIGPTEMVYICLRNGAECPHDASQIEYEHGKPYIQGGCLNIEPPEEEGSLVKTL